MIVRSFSSPVGELEAYFHSSLASGNAFNSALASRQLG
jgi:hypothetical protein